jgi:hypothetical protein
MNGGVVPDKRNRWFGGGEQLAASTKTVPFWGGSVQTTTLSTELSGQHSDIFCILLRENLNDQLCFNTSFCIIFGFSEFRIQNYF